MTTNDYIRISKYTVLLVKSDKGKEKELRTAYYELFREQLAITCDNCINDAIFRIQYYLKQLKKSIMETSKCNFKLKPGLVVYLPGASLHLTNDNLTDELAFMLLKKNRSNLAHFITYPADEVAKFLGQTPTVEKEPVKESDKTEEPEGDAKPNVPSIDDLMANNSKPELLEKLIGYPHDKSWSKLRLAEQLIKKMEEEITE